MCSSGASPKQLWKLWELRQVGFDAESLGKLAPLEDLRNAGFSVKERVSQYQKKHIEPCNSQFEKFDIEDLRTLHHDVGDEENLRPTSLFIVYGIFCNLFRGFFGVLRACSQGIFKDSKILRLNHLFPLSLKSRFGPRPNRQSRNGAGR